MNGFDSWQRLKTFPFSKISRLNVRPTQPSVLLVQNILPQGTKQPRCEGDHSPPSRAEVNNKRTCIYTYICTPTTCLHGVHSSNFPFYLLCWKTSQYELFLHVYITAHCIKAITVNLHHPKNKYCSSSLYLLNAIDNFFFIQPTSPAPNYVIFKFLSSKYKTVTTSFLAVTH